ncbi:MAG: hypothetical protein K2N90_08130 [Lachnospiraceae bacterium]|nr:hypothetical protein [Lachnospiraceae bacterium]
METEKKSRTGLVIGIAVAVIVVIVAAAAVFFAGRALGSKPELRLQAATAKMASERAEYGSSLSEKIDYDAFNKLWETGTMHIDTDVSITITDGETTNAEFSVDALLNESKKMASYDIGVGMYGFQIPFVEVAATSDTLYISLPQFLKDTYRVGLTNLGEEFNNSEWAELLDATLPNDYSVELFQENENEGASEELLAILNKSDVITQNTTLENIKNKESGRSGVRVTVTKEAVNQYIQQLGEDIFASNFYEIYMDNLMERAGDASEGARVKANVDAFIEGATAIRFKTDYVLDYYFDQKGRIVNISSPADMETEDGALLAVDINFLGEERALDIIEGGIYVKTGTDIKYLGIKRDAEVTEAFYNEDVTLLIQTDDHDSDMTFSYANDFNKEDMSYDMELMIDIPDGKLYFEADGEFTDIMKGEGYTFRINNSSLEVDDEELCYLSAVIALEPADEEPEIPDEYVDLFEMSMQDIQKMVYEAVSSVRKFGYE